MRRAGRLSPVDVVSHDFDLGDQLILQYIRCKPPHLCREGGNGLNGAILPSCTQRREGTAIPSLPTSVVQLAGAHGTSQEHYLGGMIGLKKAKEGPQCLTEATTGSL